MNRIKHRYDKLKTERDMIQLRLDAAKADADEARAQRLDIDVVQRVLQTSAAMVQNNFGSYISSIVTKAMHHVFPERINDRFVVRFRENRGQTECQLRICSAGGSEAHPYQCSGGGVWDVLAFALRAVMVVLEQPKRSRFMVCDEPFKNLHGKLPRESALDMLYNTCKSLGIQCLVVHQSDAKDGDDDVILSYARDGSRVYKVKQVAYETSVIEAVYRECYMFKTKRELDQQADDVLEYVKTKVLDGRPNRVFLTGSRAFERGVPHRMSRSDSDYDVVVDMPVEGVDEILGRIRQCRRLWHYCGLSGGRELTPSRGAASPTVSR